MSDNEYSFECSTLPQVAMPFMNTVHCDELVLVGKLLAALANSHDTGIIDTLLAEWVEHTKAHFAREEYLMGEYNFFAFPCHQEEHERALQELMEMQQQWLCNRDATLLQGYIQRWREWLQQHINTMDFVTAQFLSQFNITVKL